MEQRRQAHVKSVHSTTQRQRYLLSSPTDRGAVVQITSEEMRDMMGIL